MRNSIHSSTDLSAGSWMVESCKMEIAFQGSHPFNCSMRWKAGSTAVYKARSR